MNIETYFYSFIHGAHGLVALHQLLGDDATLDKIKDTIAATLVDERVVAAASALFLMLQNVF